MQGQGEWRQRIIGRQCVATRDPQLGDNRDPYFAQRLDIPLNRALGHLKTLGDLPSGAFSSLEEQKNRCQAVHTVHLLSSNGPDTDLVKDELIFFCNSTFLSTDEHSLILY